MFRGAASSGPRPLYTRTYSTGQESKSKCDAVSPSPARRRGRGVRAGPYPATAAPAFRKVAAASVSTSSVVSQPTQASVIETP